MFTKEFRDATEESNSYYPNQEDLNDLIRDLGLSKLSGDLLTSKLKQWNLPGESVRISGHKKCHLNSLSFFTRQNELCFCHKDTSVFEAIGISLNPKEKQLFIDSSCRSLKALLLHNGDMYLSLSPRSLCPAQ